MPKKSSGHKRNTKRRSTDAPDAYRGFALQATRILYYLLVADMDDIVSLEYFDDVGVQKTDGSRISEQDKSYTSSNPLANRSVVFWKTLRNWVEAAGSNKLLAASTKYIAYAPNATMGAWVKSFDSAKNCDEAKAALSLVRKELSKSNGELVISEAAREHVEVVFGADPSLVELIIANFTADCTDVDQNATLKGLLHEKLVGEDSFDLVIQQAHGWVKAWIDEALGAKKPVQILKRDFHSALLNYVRTHDRINLLRSVAGTPSPEEIETELAIRQYVQQLRIVQMEDVDILGAINDYLSASVDRTNWSEQGLITEDSLRTLEEDLTVTWRNICRRVRIGQNSLNSVSQGQLIYADCIQHSSRIDHLDTPQKFIRGSWHALADDHTVGWHPNYTTELKRQEEQEKSDLKRIGRT